MYKAQGPLGTIAAFVCFHSFFPIAPFRPLQRRPPFITEHFFQLRRNHPESLTSAPVPPGDLSPTTQTTPPFPIGDIITAIGRNFPQKLAISCHSTRLSSPNKTNRSGVSDAIPDTARCLPVPFSLVPLTLRRTAAGLASTSADPSCTPGRKWMQRHLSASSQPESSSHSNLLES